MKVFYSREYVAAKHSFDTTRKSSHLAASLRSDPIEGVELTEPRPATAAMISRVHSPQYVQAVRTGKAGCSSQGFPWDSGLWTAVTASTGGVVAAAHAAIRDGVSGSLSSGLHHARYDHGAGFCTFNGLVVAANEALDALPADKRVLIIDADAHCGGGTDELIRLLPALDHEGKCRIDHLDLYVSPFDWYPIEDELHARFGGQRWSHSVDCDQAEEYLPSLQAMLGCLAECEGFDDRYGLVLYNSGMDPHQDDSCGGLEGITTEIIHEREHLVFDWAATHDLPIAFVLAGGYTGTEMDPGKLTGLHRLTMEAAVDPLSEGVREHCALARAVEAHGLAFHPTPNQESRRAAYEREQVLQLAWTEDEAALVALLEAAETVLAEAECSNAAYHRDGWNCVECGEVT